MKIYTKTGDEGKTSLFGGKRVSKDSPRVEAYGAVDELNAILGIAMTHVDDETLHERLLTLQRELFVIGADLATPDEEKGGGKAASWVPRMTGERIQQLEVWIDEAQDELTPMKAFILPGGVPAAVHLHHARTVCRRAERRVVALEHWETVGEFVRIYLNRLSDLLFVWARLANQRAGVDDRPWKAPKH